MTFTTRQLVEASGLTYRQLDHWARTGALVPSVRVAAGEGSKRAYSERDRAAAIVVGRIARGWPDRQVPQRLVGLVVERVRNGADGPIWMPFGEGVGLFIEDGGEAVA